MNSSENELIRQAQSANTDAFCQLAGRYQRRIYSLALHYCHNPQDAEDLSQEVWLKAYQALTTFRGESSFYTWLRKITINCFLNHQRTRSFRWRGQTNGVQLLTLDTCENEQRLMSGVNPETTLHNRILAERVRQALRELTPNQRLIFLLKHHEGMTYEEIATAVGCSPGTAKKSVSRAIAKLREHLDVEVESPNCIPCAAGEY